MAQAWEADAGPVHVEFTNGAKVAAGFAAAPRAMKAAQRKANAQTGREVRGWIRSEAASATRQQRRMAGGIGSAGNSTQAVITMRNTPGAPGAMGAFLGSKNYRQFPAPIAPNWVVGGPGGPMVVNPTIRKHKDDIETIHLDGQLNAAAGRLTRI